MSAASAANMLRLSWCPVLLLLLWPCFLAAPPAVLPGDFQPCGDGLDECAGWTASGWDRIAENRAVKFLSARRSGDKIDVGERIRVRVNVTKNLYVDIGMCGRNCTVFHTGGLEDNVLGYTVYKTGDANIRSHEAQVVTPYAGSCMFPVGENLVFVVERLSRDEMAVWLDGHSLRAVSFPITADQDRLEVYADAGVPEFVDPKVRHLGDALAVGERARLQTNVTRDTRIHIGLCGGNCSGVTATGVRDSAIGYATFNTRGNTILHPRAEKEFGGPDEFKKGDVIVFIVERKSPLETAVWLERIPDKVIKFQTRADQDKLNAFALFHDVHVLSTREDDLPSMAWVHIARGESNAILSPPLAALPGRELCVTVEYQLPVFTTPERRILETPAGPAILVWGKNTMERPHVLRGHSTANAMGWVRRDVTLLHPRDVDTWQLAISMRGGLPATVRTVLPCDT